MQNKWGCRHFLGGATELLQNLSYCLVLCFYPEPVPGPLVSGKGQILLKLVNNRGVVLVRRLVERFVVEQERVDGVSHLRECLLLLDVAVMNLRTDLRERNPVLLCGGNH